MTILVWILVCNAYIHWSSISFLMGIIVVFHHITRNHHSKVLRSPPRLGWPLWTICVTNDHGYVPLVVNTSRSFPRSRLITGFIARFTRRLSLVEQELITFPEHLSSLLVFWWGSCYSIFSFICMFCWSLFALLYFFFWPLCSSSM